MYAYDIRINNAIHTDLASVFDILAQNFTERQLSILSVRMTAPLAVVVDLILGPTLKPLWAADGLRVWYHTDRIFRQDYGV